MTPYMESGTTSAAIPTPPSQPTYPSKFYSLMTYYPLISFDCESFSWLEPHCDNMCAQVLSYP